MVRCLSGSNDETSETLFAGDECSVFTVTGQRPKGGDGMMGAVDDLALAPLFAFLNSHDLGDRGDWLTPEAYRSWVEDQAAGAVLDIPDAARPAIRAELLALAGDADAEPDEIARAREVRDALLALLTDPDIDRDAVAAELDRLAAPLPLRLRVAPGGRVAVEPALHGPLAIAARALILAHDAAVDGTWDRIGCCCSDSCHWAFVDRSKNHSRRWCSMGDCGAREKARAYRARRRSGD
jgi:hypothetical protein